MTMKYAVAQAGKGNNENPEIKHVTVRKEGTLPFESIGKSQLEVPNPSDEETDAPDEDTLRLRLNRVIEVATSPDDQPVVSKAPTGQPQTQRGSTLYTSSAAWQSNSADAQDFSNRQQEMHNERGFEDYMDIVDPTREASRIWGQARLRTSQEAPQQNRPLIQRLGEDVVNRMGYLYQHKLKNGESCAVGGSVLRQWPTGSIVHRGNEGNRGQGHPEVEGRARSCWPTNSSTG